MLVSGGATRKESVYNCLINTNSDIVLIHDGVRPLIKQTYIDECIRNMSDFDGVSIAVKAKDTIKITDDNGIVVKTTQREHTWLVQTPQCFKRDILLEAHKNFGTNELITDDCILLELMGKKVKLIEGDYTNMKITVPEDFIVITKIL